MSDENQNRQNTSTTVGVGGSFNTDEADGAEWNQYKKSSIVDVGCILAEQYEIIEQLGQGGMGVVFKARDIVLNRLVAIKVLQTDSGAKEAKSLRFQQEARVIAGLDHKNIVRVHAIATTADGAPFFVMEFVEGRSLAEELKRQRRLPIDRAVMIFRQACDAVEHAHAKGVVHRDIKPSNLMLVGDSESGQETVKLLDFGIAKLHSADGETIQQLTQAGELCGSPFYMSPEQSEGKRVDIRTDIYALGCVFYEMLCGVPPFKGATAVETLLLHQTSDPKPVWQECSELGSANALDFMIMKMLAKSPENRFASISQVRLALDQALLYQKGSFSSFIARCQANLRRKKIRKQLLVCAAFVMPLVLLWVPIAAWSYAVSIGHLPPGDITTDLFGKDWKESDAIGQREFNDGNYKAAEIAFRKAVFKGKIDLSDKRLMRLRSSLYDLSCLYDVTGQRAERDDVLTQLSTLPPAPRTQDDITLNAFETAEKDLDKNGSASSLSRYIDSAIQALYVIGVSGSEKRLGPVFDRIISHLHSAQTAHHVTLSEAQIAKVGLIRVFCSIPKSGPPKTVLLENGETVSRAELFRRLLRLPRQDVTNACTLLIVMLSQPAKEEGVPVDECKKLLQQIIEHGGPAEKADALMLLGDIHLEIHEMYDANGCFSRALEIVQSAEERNYRRLMVCLLQFGKLFELDRNPSRALPYYKRCEAILKATSSVPPEIYDLIKRSLAQVYIDLGQLYNAEQILLNLEASLNRTDPNGLERARTLAELGYLYCLNSDFGRGERLLLDSIELFKRLPANNANRHDTYARAMSNLRMLYLKQGKMNEVEYWGKQVKKLNAVEVVVD